MLKFWIIFFQILFRPPLIHIRTCPKLSVRIPASQHNELAHQLLENGWTENQTVHLPGGHLRRKCLGTGRPWIILLIISRFDLGEPSCFDLQARISGSVCARDSKVRCWPSTAMSPLEVILQRWITNKESAGRKTSIVKSASWNSEPGKETKFRMPWSKKLTDWMNTNFSKIESSEVKVQKTLAGRVAWWLLWHSGGSNL